MPTSEGFRFGDVVVVPFPYADKLAEKRRPALVVSSPDLSRLGVIWVVMITSASHRGWACDVPIDDVAPTGLSSASVVRPAKIACIDPDRVIRRAGAVSERIASRVREQISRFLVEG